MCEPVWPQREIKTVTLSPTIAGRSPFVRIRKGTTSCRLGYSNNSPDEMCMLQNSLHVEHASPLSGPHKG
jgi:hypothetical protein